MNKPTSLLQHPILSRVRRNHGLEHASIHVLSSKHPGKSIAGHSDPRGFWLLGDLETEQVREGVQQALTRMRNGEHKLAVHPNCGTNFVTSGIAAGLVAALAMFGAHKWRDKLSRIPLAMSLATLALIVTHPLGFIIQERVTTSGYPEDMEIVEVIPTRQGRFKAHRIVTRG
ncbi:MAG: DUF6391 domain-containing protein [Anaerolineales bacterium]